MTTLGTQATESEIRCAMQMKVASSWKLHLRDDADYEGTPDPVVEVL